MLAVFQNVAEDHEWTESECEILSTLTKMVESYLCRAYMQREGKEPEKKSEKETPREELDSMTGTCTKEFFGRKSSRRCSGRIPSMQLQCLVSEAMKRLLSVEEQRWSGLYYSILALISARI